MTAAPAGVAPPDRIAWSDPAFARIAAVVHLVAGLTFPENRRASAEASMRRAIAATGVPDATALATAAERPGEARDALLAELTVGETYFFREPAQLDALRTHVLPTIRAAGRLDAPLRIWSAGCASGEEPYTLAMLLQEQGWAGATRILATDVSRPRLDAARRGRYTRWSMRASSAARVARWFTPRGAHFHIAPEIQAPVEFAVLNLVADEYPSANPATMNQDVVFCRNVLIYFDMETVARIATRLLASLAPDGWLFLGASDPLLVGLVPCEAVTLPGGIAYRRADRRGTTVAERQPPIVPRVSYLLDATVLDEGVQPDAARPDLSRRMVADDVVPSPGSGPAPGADAPASHECVEDWIARVRADADAGRLREAEDACVRALDSFRLSAELHYLHGLLLSSAGRSADATRAARRALYLDGHFVMARLLLGESLARLGDSASARQALETVIAELGAIADTVPIAAADGTPASAVRRVAERWLARVTGMPA